MYSTGWDVFLQEKLAGENEHFRADADKCAAVARRFQEEMSAEAAL